MMLSTIAGLIVSKWRW